MQKLQAICCHSCNSFVYSIFSSLFLFYWMFLLQVLCKHHQSRWSPPSSFSSAIITIPPHVSLKFILCSSMCLLPAWSSHNCWMLSKAEQQFFVKSENISYLKIQPNLFIVSTKDLNINSNQWSVLHLTIDYQR